MSSDPVPPAELEALRDRHIYWLGNSNVRYEYLHAAYFAAHYAWPTPNLRVVGRDGKAAIVDDITRSEFKCYKNTRGASWEEGWRNYYRFSSLDLLTNDSNAAQEKCDCYRSNAEDVPFREHRRFHNAKLNLTLSFTFANPLSVPIYALPDWSDGALQSCSPWCLPREQSETRRLYDMASFLRVQVARATPDVLLVGFDNTVPLQPGQNASLAASEHWPWTRVVLASASAAAARLVWRAATPWLATKLLPCKGFECWHRISGAHVPLDFIKHVLFTPPVASSAGRNCSAANSSVDIVGGHFCAPSHACKILYFHNVWRHLHAFAAHRKIDASVDKLLKALYVDSKGIHVNTDANVVLAKAALAVVTKALASCDANEKGARADYLPGGSVVAELA